MFASRPSGPRRGPDRRARSARTGLSALTLALAACATGRAPAEIEPGLVLSGPAPPAPEGTPPTGSSATLAVVVSDWLRLEPSSSWPDALALAAAALAADDVDRACAHLEEGIEAAPGDPLLHEARAAMLVELGYLRAAEADLERAVQLAPGRARAWSALGRVRYALELHVRATRALEKAVHLGLDDPAHLLLLACARCGAGMHEEALEAFAAALRELGRRERGGPLFRSALHEGGGGMGVSPLETSHHLLGD